MGDIKYCSIKTSELSDVFRLPLLRKNSALPTVSLVETSSSVVRVAGHDPSRLHLRRPWYRVREIRNTSKTLVVVVVVRRQRPVKNGEDPAASTPTPMQTPADLASCMFLVVRVHVVSAVL